MVLFAVVAGILLSKVFSYSEGAFSAALMIFFYFLPTLAAGSRKHLNKEAIFALNLLAGWTVLGWLVAFVWAFTNNRKLPA